MGPIHGGSNTGRNGQSTAADHRSHSDHNERTRTIEKNTPRSQSHRTRNSPLARLGLANAKETPTATKSHRTDTDPPVHPHAGRLPSMRFPCQYPMNTPWYPATFAHTGRYRSYDSKKVRTPLITQPSLVLSIDATPTLCTRPIPTSKVRVHDLALASSSHQMKRTVCAQLCVMPNLMEWTYLEKANSDAPQRIFTEVRLSEPVFLPWRFAATAKIMRNHNGHQALYS